MPRLALVLVLPLRSAGYGLAVLTTWEKVVKQASERLSVLRSPAMTR